MALFEMETTAEKVTIVNNLSIQIRDEDHTILNPLRWAISNNWLGDTVEFCGYTIPHPSERVAHVNVQFENKEIQSPKNILKKMYESLECIEAMANKLLNSLDYQKDVLKNV